MDKLELIIFDLGRVLLDFDFKKVIRDLKRHSPKTEEHIHSYFGETILWDHFERGKINAEDFFAALKKDLLLEGLTFQAFTPMWNDIFTEKRDTIEILQQLRGRYRLAMISNVNPLHWEYVKGKHEFMTWFEHPMASYAVGLRKPEPEIFKLMLQEAKVPAHNAVFIDDIASHIEAARAVGIRGHQFQTAEQLRVDLKELL